MEVEEHAGDGAFLERLGAMPWDKGASVRDPAAITWRPQWGTTGRQEAGQAAFLKGKGSPGWQR